MNIIKHLIIFLEGFNDYCENLLNRRLNSARDLPFKFQKQPPRGVLRRRCSENVRQI